MRALILVAVLAVSTLAAAFPVFEPVQPATACSCSECDFVGESAVVLRGTFIGWDYVRDASGAPVERRLEDGTPTRPEYRPTERPIEMTVAVDTVFKGSAPERVIVQSAHYDRYLRAEGSPLYGHWAWPGEAGACFALGEDPTGQDMLILLVPAGEPGVFKLTVAPHPFSEFETEGFNIRFPGLGAPYPPAVGDSPPSQVSAGSDDWMFVSAIGAGLVLFTLVLILIGPRNERKRDHRSEGDEG